MMSWPQGGKAHCKHQYTPFLFGPYSTSATFLPSRPSFSLIMWFVIIHNPASRDSYTPAIPETGSDWSVKSHWFSQCINHSRLCLVVSFMSHWEPSPGQARSRPYYVWELKQSLEEVDGRLLRPRWQTNIPRLGKVELTGFWKTRSSIL